MSLRGTECRGNLGVVLGGVHRLPSTEIASSLALLAKTVEVGQDCFAEFTLSQILWSLHSLRMTEGEGLAMTEEEVTMTRRKEHTPELRPRHGHNRWQLIPKNLTVSTFFTSSAKGMSNTTT